MTLRPRAGHAPRPVIGCWAVSAIAGLALVGLGPHPTREPNALSPYSLAGYLHRAAGPDARDIRVNSFYGSGHHGAWQFIAHLTWRTPDGQIAGGVTSLPELASAAAWDSNFDGDRLVTEQQLGWTLDTLDRVLDAFDSVDAPLAMLNLDIVTGQSAEVVHCHSRSGRSGTCEARGQDGRRRTFHDELLDEPLLGAASVQRTGAPITGLGVG